MNDHQEVYAWTWHGVTWGSESLTVAKARVLARKINPAYKLLPTLENYSFVVPETGTICYNTDWGLQPRILIHELAHVRQLETAKPAKGQKYGCGHNGDFIAHFARLAEELGYAKAADVRQSALDWGLECGKLTFPKIC